MKQVTCLIKSWGRFSTFAVVVALPALSAHAGMPSVTLTDIARMRLETLSFFLLLLFISTCVIQVLWNWIRRDFVRLPVLTFGRALALVTLWGFLFVLVLTMISGARELMTPGAWVKDGVTYKLKNSGSEGRAAAAVWEKIDAQRSERLAALRSALWDYARTHGGAFPENDRVAEIPESAWETADPSRMRYTYFPGHRLGDGAAALVAEPDVFGGTSWVLWCDGRMAEVPEGQLQGLIKSELHPVVPTTQAGAR